MELGQRLKQARLEAGMSQRQLCGEEITRNMLSQIENGSARPSMATLQYLAGRLGKTVSYFLEEDVVLSPNQKVMAQARDAWKHRNYASVLEALTCYQPQDTTYDEERYFLEALAGIALAEDAIKQGKLPYAFSLLDAAGKAGQHTPYYTYANERQRILLLGETGMAKPEELVKHLPPDDRELLLRAEAAFNSKNLPLCETLLDAALNQTAPHWNLLRGETYFAAGSFARAAECYLLAEDSFPRKVIPRLEHCFRELEDYKRAYEYACKQR